eukprot:2767703-Prymnesium_polylepis.1
MNVSAALDSAAEHAAHWAQANHRCSKAQLAKLSRVRHVVDGVRACGCSLAPKTTGGAAQRHHCDELNDVRRRDGWDGVANTTRVFVGDSKMSGDAR